MGIRVLEHIKPDNSRITLKVKPPPACSAAKHGVLAPKVHGCYDIVLRNLSKPEIRVMVSELVQGDPLHLIWHEYTDEEKASVREQLRVQLAAMRRLTQPYMGQLHREPFHCAYDAIKSNLIGPFDSEEAFDEWCLARLNERPLASWKWKRWLKKKRQQSSGKFVLTHGDLTPRNIMVQGSTVTGIIDWEWSAFLPEYAEYAFAMKLCYGLEEWWIPILEEILEPCDKQRLKFTKKIQDRPWL